MAIIDDPANTETFDRCRLNLGERESNQMLYQLHKDLLRLRREESVLAPRDQRNCDGATLGEQTLILRYFGERPLDDRLLVVNLGTERNFCPLAEPLLAAPENMRWKVSWSSEDVQYGGLGTPELIMNEDWKLRGEAALWLMPEEDDDE
jgi:maltooligosyltrehalose trehalohydrolase